MFLVYTTKVYDLPERVAHMPFLFALLVRAEYGIVKEKNLQHETCEYGILLRTCVERVPQFLYEKWPY